MMEDWNALKVHPHQMLFWEVHLMQKKMGEFLLPTLFPTVCQ
jgi:hypothetical protein